MPDGSAVSGRRDVESDPEPESVLEVAVAVERDRAAPLLAVNRLQGFSDPDRKVREELSVLIAVLATLPGFRSARAGRCIDEPDLWLLLSEWDSVGTYRRALSSHAVKTSGHPVFVRVVDEPGAYEVLLSSG